MAGARLTFAYGWGVVVVMIILSGAGREVAEGAADCTTVLQSLVPCEPFVLNQAATPSANCCVGLKSVVKTNVTCLCVLLSNPSIPINMTRALELPSLCNVTVPNPASVCAASPTPVPSNNTSAMPPNMYMGPMPMGPTTSTSGSFPFSSTIPSFMYAAMSIFGTSFLMQLHA